MICWKLLTLSHQLLFFDGFCFCACVFVCLFLTTLCCSETKMIFEVSNMLEMLHGVLQACVLPMHWGRKAVLQSRLVGNLDICFCTKSSGTDKGVICPLRNTQSELRVAVCCAELHLRGTGDFGMAAQGLIPPPLSYPWWELSLGSIVYLRGVQRDMAGFHSVSLNKLSKRITFSGKAITNKGANHNFFGGLWFHLCDSGLYSCSMT